MAITPKISAAARRRLSEYPRKFLSIFSPEDKVLVLISADPDALGAALAVKRLLWRKVAGVTIASSNEISRPDNLAMVRLLRIPLEKLSGLKATDFSRVVMVDSQPHHNEAFGALPVHAVIDHHPPGDRLAGMAYVDVRPKYGATSSILVEYLQGAGIKASVRLATALAYGIKNDTSAFQRPYLEEDVNAFRHLVSRTNHSVMRKIEFSEMRIKDLAILRQALDKATRRKHTMFAHLGAVKSPDNLVQIADFFLRVEVIDASVVSGTYQDKLIVILRNVAPRASAGKMAEQAFGALGSAGGHKAMARAEVPLAALEPVLKDKGEEALGRFVMRSITKKVPKKK